MSLVAVKLKNAMHLLPPLPRRVRAKTWEKRVAANFVPMHEHAKKPAREAFGGEGWGEGVRSEAAGARPAAILPKANNGPDQMHHIVDETKQLTRMLQSLANARSTPKP